MRARGDPSMNLLYLYIWADADSFRIGIRSLICHCFCHTASLGVLLLLDAVRTVLAPLDAVPTELKTSPRLATSSVADCAGSCCEAEFGMSSNELFAVLTYVQESVCAALSVATEVRDVV